MRPYRGSGGTGATGGSGGAGGSSGTGATGGTGGASGSGGTGGSGGASGSGGTGATGGSGGASGSGGTSGSGGSGGASGTGGTGGSGGASGSGGGGGCSAGTADCDADPANGCETALNLLTSCGSCTTVCDNTQGDVQCNPQTLSCEVKSCVSGRANCDNDANNGCEADVLTDPTNCGACGKSCLGAACTDGKCDATPLGDAWGFVHGTAVATSAIWQIGASSSLNSNFQLRKFPKDASGVVVVDSGSYGSGGVGADGDDLYYALRGSPAAVYEIPSGGTKTLAFSPASNPDRFTLAQNQFFWVDDAHNIVKAQKDGTGETVLAMGQQTVFDITATTTNVYWISWNGTIRTLRTVPIAGGSVTDVDVVAYTTALFPFGGGLYFNVRNGNPLDKIAVHTPSGGTQTLKSGNTYDSVATDGTVLWYGIFDGNNNTPIYREPIASTGSVLLTTPPFPGIDHIIAVEASYLYGWNSGGGKIYKVVR